MRRRKLARSAQAFIFVAAMMLAFGTQLPLAVFAQDRTDPVTGFARAPVHVAAWPGGKKVAVSFALFVEEFGFGQGPVFRPDLATRNPDLVNEAFRQYAIDWGIARVGRLFRELDVPLSTVLNAEFPGKHASVWKEFRATQPNSPIIAHGMNNTSHMLPLGRGIAEQKAYIRRTRDAIEDATGVKPAGWSSPSVYANGDTMQAMAAEGITYNLDQMDSDIVSRLEDAGWIADATALSRRYGGHGPISRTDEDDYRDRNALAGLCLGVSPRGPRQSGEGGNDGGDRNPSICRWHARRGGRLAACSAAPQG